jgi:predicted carbohydrate-binding protein with CBM5 and CBM33 domain
MSELPAFLDPRLPGRPSPAVFERPRPHLRLVPTAAPSASRLPFVLLVIGLLGAGLLGLLLVNTASAQGSFQVSRLQDRSQQLTDQEQALHARIANQQSAASLTRRAKAMGMVPAQAPTVVHLPDGRNVAAATSAPDAGQ